MKRLASFCLFAAFFLGLPDVSLGHLDQSPHQIVGLSDSLRFGHGSLSVPQYTIWISHFPNRPMDKPDQRIIAGKNGRRDRSRDDGGEQAADPRHRTAMQPRHNDVVIGQFVIMLSTSDFGSTLETVFARHLGPLHLSVFDGHMTATRLLPPVVVVRNGRIERQSPGVCVDVFWRLPGPNSPVRVGRSVQSAAHDDPIRRPAFRTVEGKLIQSARASGHRWIKRGELHLSFGTYILDSSDFRGIMDIQPNGSIIHDPNASDLD